MTTPTYPIKYIKPIQLEDGTLIQLRPIHPMDGGKAKEFKSSLSVKSIFARFHGYVPPVSKKMVKRLTQIDYKKEMAIVAEVMKGKEKQIIAVARIAYDVDKTVEFAIIISDKWQGKRLGTILTDYMIFIARDMGFRYISAFVLNENTKMLEILRRRGFKFEQEDGSTLKAILKLKKKK